MPSALGALAIDTPRTLGASSCATVMVKTMDAVSPSSSVASRVYVSGKDAADGAPEMTMAAASKPSPSGSAGSELSA